MTIEARTYNMTPGSISFVAPELSSVTILCVKREGIQYDDSNGAAPGAREFRYIMAFGRIIFLNPFTGNIGPGASSDYDYEKVYVRYKY